MYLNPDLFKCPQNLSTLDHSSKIDKFLDLRALEVEKRLHIKGRGAFDNNVWIGLEPQILQTPFNEIYESFHEILSGKAIEIKKVVDLGAAYGRVGIVASAMIPDLEFIGYELVQDRVDEGRRVIAELGLNKVQLLQMDILDDGFELERAQVYFIYDFSDPPQIKKILKKIARLLKTEKFYLVARGDGIRSLIQSKFPQLWAPFEALHRENWSLYSSFSDVFEC